MKKIISTMIALVMFFQASLFIKPVEADSDLLGIQAKAAILIEASTGKILYEKNSETALPVASMTKMMTEYLVLEAIDNGTIQMNQKIRVSDYVHMISQNTTLSNVHLEKDGQYTVEELYEAMAIYSANGATIALAELVGGSETSFVKMMNDKAKKIGMKNYRFVNSTGLNNKDLYDKHPEGTDKDEENMMSANDTALLAYRLINDFPEVLKISSVPKKTFQEGGKYPIKMENWNWMLPSLVYGYEGTDGIKTGSTDQAGYCFTGTAKRNDVRVISVVMDTKSYKARFDETKKLFDYGFNNFSKQEIFPATKTLKSMKTLPVSKGKKDSVKIVALSKEPLFVFMKNGEKIEYKQKIVLNKKKLNDDGELTAPIKKNQAIGKLVLEPKDNTEYGFITGEKSLEVKIVTKQSVEKAGWIVLTIRSIGDFFGDLWDQALDLI